MGDPNCNAKVNLKKGPWTREEDQKLVAYIEEHGHRSWRTLPAKAGNYLSCNTPTIRTVSTSMANEVIPTDNYYGVCGAGQAEYYHTGTKDKMAKSPYDCPTSYDFDMMGSMDLASSSLFNHDSDVYKIGGSDVGEFEASENYWNELLDLVSSNMM